MPLITKEESKPDILKNKDRNVLNPKRFEDETQEEYRIRRIEVKYAIKKRLLGVKDEKILMPQ